ncbi:MAG: hypothetical protein QM757_14295 [Paludibaculum sp.]
MKDLTGVAGWSDAWKQFVEPGDVVGIKLNPVGRPHCMSDASVLHQIVDGLKAAGIKAQDIVVYDRYRSEFLEAGFEQVAAGGCPLDHRGQRRRLHPAGHQRLRPRSLHGYGARSTRAGHLE